MASWPRQRAFVGVKPISSAAIGTSWTAKQFVIASLPMP
jgi:hypothetical protein